VPRKIAVAAHAKTGLPLAGGHEKVACPACHGEGPDRRRQPELAGCAGCHEDPHGGAFASWDGGECSRCHEVSGFYPSLYGIEQHATSAFPLEGRHRAAPCGGCHGERPRQSFEVADRACARCHKAPHGDQFAAEMGKSGCAHCHSFVGWEARNIDHSAWPRDGAHAALPCQSCHTATEEDRRAGRGPSYRGIPTECTGCHEDPHAGQFRLSDPVRECGSCHTTKSFGPPDLDHEKLAGFSLVGRHAETDCTACHPVEVLEGGAKVRRFRLGYRQCRDCHANPHGMGSPRRKRR
jgi:hypothetical protein